MFQDEIEDDMLSLQEVEPGDDGSGMFEHFRFVSSLIIRSLGSS